MHMTTKHPFVFHLVQESLWQRAVSTGEIYYPPTYAQDGFTHGTANPELLLNVANHFYKDVPGSWLCLKMTAASLNVSGVEVVYEGTAPVGDREPDFEGSQDERFPHILGGIHPDAVVDVCDVKRSANGGFLSVEGITTNPL